MDGGNGDDVGVVLGVEIVEIGLVLEVVGVDSAVFDNGVGHDIVIIDLDVEGDVLLGEDALHDLEDLSVRGRRSGDGDGLTAQSVVVDSGVKAVGRGIHGADNGAVILLVDVVDDLLALQSGDQGKDLGRGLVAFLHGQNVGVSGGGAFDHEGVGHGVQARVDGVVGVDDGVVNVLQDVGDLRGLGLHDLDVVRVFDNVVLGGGDAGTVGELDDAVVLEQEQRAGFVGRVVGDGDLDGGGAVAGVVALGAAAGQGQSGSEDQCKDKGGQLDRMLFHRFVLLTYFIIASFWNGQTAGSVCCSSSKKQREVIDLPLPLRCFSQTVSERK